MIDGKFDVVFRGQIVKNFDINTVKANLVKLFKSSPEAIERLFSGVETPIRKGLDYTAAMKYQSALKNAGALALIKEVEAEKPKLQSSVSGKATFGAAQDEPSQSAPTQASSPQPAASPVALQQPKSPQPSQESRHAPNDTAETFDGDLTMAEVGTQILPDKVYEKRDVDTSSLSLAAAGERILPEKAPEAHEEPNIDHLKITDDTSPISGERES